MSQFSWETAVELTLQARLCTLYMTRGVIDVDGEFRDSDGHQLTIARQRARINL